MPSEPGHRLLSPFRNKRQGQQDRPHRKPPGNRCDKVSAVTGDVQDHLAQHLWWNGRAAFIKCRIAFNRHARACLFCFINIWLLMKKAGLKHARSPDVTWQGTIPSAGAHLEFTNRRAFPDHQSTPSITSYRRRSNGKSLSR